MSEFADIDENSQVLRSFGEMLERSGKQTAELITWMIYGKLYDEQYREKVARETAGLKRRLDEVGTDGERHRQAFELLKRILKETDFPHEADPEDHVYCMCCNAWIDHDNHDEDCLYLEIKKLVDGEQTSPDQLG